MSEKLPTHISEVDGFQPVNGAIGNGLAGNGLISGDLTPRTTAWLDELLGGGLALPARLAGKSRALSILITGPPGTGKSTLALELAYRWSCLAGTDLPAGLQQTTGGQPLQVVYATMETAPEDMLHNAASYQWKHFQEKAAVIRSLGDRQAGRVNLISLADLTAAGATGPNEPEQPVPGRDWLDRIRTAWQTPAEAFASQRPPTRPPEVLIIDSLNFLPGEDDRERFHQTFVRLTGSGPVIVIFVLGTSPRHPQAELWEAAGDVIIRLDQGEPAGNPNSRTRQVEIVKARFQAHARGKHQLTIRPGFTNGPAGERQNQGDCRKMADRLRARTGRTEGGIFIIPSTEFLLGRAPHPSPEPELPAGPPQYYKPKTPNLKRLVGQGFPLGQCTAMLGDRGGHKSHLGYVELLYRLVCASDCRTRPARVENVGKASPDGQVLKLATEPPAWPARFGPAAGSPLTVPAPLKIVTAAGGMERLPERLPAPVPAPLRSPAAPPGASRKHAEKALVVSLRDDEVTTRRTMSRILHKWREHNSDVPTLAALEENGRLEIMHFPPGYTTPDEFFHRLLLGIHRLKYADDSQPGISLLFNSLDQLTARLPLCASEPVFIPSLLQLLAGEQVTSFFVATREEERPDYHGLGSLAGVILEFEYRDFPREDVRLHLTAVMPGQQAIHNSDSTKLKNQSLRQAVVVTLRRFAGGQAAGEEGILELLPDEASRKELDLGQNYAAEDLIFIPRNPMQKGDFGFDARLVERPTMVLVP